MNILDPERLKELSDKGLVAEFERLLRYEEWNKAEYGLSIREGQPEFVKQYQWVKDEILRRLSQSPASRG